MTDSKLLILEMHPREFYSLDQRDIEWELTHRYSKDIKDKRPLELYTKWLAKQIPFLGLTGHTASSRVIRDACDYLSTRKYEKHLVLNVFNQHKEDYLRDRPKDTRTFNFARREIEINYKLRSVHRKVKNSSAPKEAASATCLPGLSQPARLSNQANEPISGTRNSGNVHPDPEDSHLSRRQKLLAKLDKLKSGTPPPETSSSNEQKPRAGYTTASKPADIERRLKTDLIETTQSLQIYQQKDQDESPDFQESAVGPSRSGSNSKPVGHRSRSGSSRPIDSHLEDDSYRPERLSQRVDTYRPNDPRQSIDTYRPDTSRRLDDRCRPSENRHLHFAYRPKESERIGRSDLKKSVEPTPARNVGEKEAKLSSRLKKRRTDDGRLSPWDDIERPAKRQRPAQRQQHEDSFAGGLPWDDVEMSPKENQQVAPVDQITQDLEPEKKDSGVNIRAKQAGASEDIPMETGGAVDSAEAMERKKVTDSQWKQAGIEAEDLLAVLERDLFFQAKPDVVEAMGGTQPNGGSMIVTSSSPSPVTSYRSIIPDSFGWDDYDNGNEGNDDVYMEDAPEGMDQAPSSPIEVDHGSFHTKEAIVPLKTPKPLQRVPLYDPAVLALFRGREHENVHLNIARRRTAVEMYEAEEKEGEEPLPLRR
ncbi:hypothetical protein BDP55DRAFT_723482 [Colletotrichum godetiae]|uniref:Uncharacterized protein n=1 Tax=Colletotrichum godetiae TaxID=1209918 RepID=A0AAJ0AZI9_9PEZI|nr:uncharacterized protein BDP55DRAFT_723482 [Colletotrichum godetiae]KAK1699844.1 hypothetical protein BDP55DRAFT_723482 [Colletotrichum godetiae]